MSIVFYDLIQFAIFVLVLRRTKLLDSEILQAHRMVQKITMYPTENL